jgi:hypothetical protein
VPLAVWEVWLGRPLAAHEGKAGGGFEVPGALAPVEVRAGGRGVYQVPNVWVHHPSKAAA